MRVNCKYEYTNMFHKKHRWVVECATMAVELWFSVSDKYPPSAGLEIHSTFPLPDSKSDAPHHCFCNCLSYRPCWHTGSSAYATDHYGPMLDFLIRDPEFVFKLLREELSNRLFDYGHLDPPSNHESHREARNSNE